jgi:large subunit ribosomal protein L28
MAKVCAVTGKKPVSGNRVSHANNKARRTWEPNLHDKRFYSPALGRFVTLRVSAKGMKTIDKRGIDAVLLDLDKNGVKY